MWNKVFRLGQLEVYESSIVLTTHPEDPLPCYYWADPKSPQGCGPFVSIQKCIEHYEKYAQHTDLAVLPPPSNVLNVDFKAKKTILPPKVD